jgi:hypothetical protein
MWSKRGRLTLSSLLCLFAVIGAVVLAGFASAADVPLNTDRADSAVLVQSPASCGGATGSLCQDADGWRWVYDSSTNSFTEVQKSSPEVVGGIRYVYSYAPSCDGDSPDTTKLCGHALTACNVADPGAIYYDVWRRETAPEPGEPVVQGSICLGGLADTVTVAQLGDDLAEDVRDHLPTFAIAAQPSPTVIVNLPVIVSAPAEPAPNFVVADPVPGAVTVTSTYTWTFDDGATVVGIGRTYDGTDPRTAAPGYYLDHTYSRADASGSVSLVVSWHAMFTVDGGPPVALADILTPAQIIRFEVHEVRSVLVSG